MNATSTPIPAVSVVIIGRNEGQRLLRCIASVQQAHWGALRHDIWYVDSRSTDDSLASAQALGAHTLVLPEGPMCAAKARNLGWQAAEGECILFLDGDTELHPDFVTHALLALEDGNLCAAWGHRRESNPQQSLYTKVLDLDWIYPAGITPYFGGDVLVRRSALAQVGGFDATLNAGEEPELCARLRAKGWKILHIDVPMTRHDLAVRSFKAYARRCYRSGIAYAEVTHRMQTLGDALWQHEARRDLVHGLLYVAAPLLLALAFALHVLAGALLAVLGLAVLLRSAWRCRARAAGNAVLALQYALHSHVQKVPALFGQLAWMRAHARQQRLALVDYKE
jgi:cellulose synthase/poly-beta-1,6-N-acetylglucosamine synthase-like glycosyltransferase